MSQIFGPVPSRRLGFSLGVDVISFKTCSLDCIYCQLSKTTDRTVKRKEYINADGTGGGATGFLAAIAVPMMGLTAIVENLPFSDFF